VATDVAVFIGLLSACSHSELVGYFYSVRKILALYRRLNTMDAW
jgi:hypothetical protein